MGNTVILLRQFLWNEIDPLSEQPPSVLNVLRFEVDLDLLLHVADVHEIQWVLDDLVPTDQDHIGALGPRNPKLVDLESEIENFLREAEPACLERERSLEEIQSLGRYLRPLQLPFLWRPLPDLQFLAFPKSAFQGIRLGSCEIVVDEAEVQMEIELRFEVNDKTMFWFTVS